MIAYQNNLFKLLNGSKQFIVPIYQRTYSWNEKQCNQLWRDICVLAIKTRIQSHFIGSIVYESIPTPMALPQQYRVIDGQQRLVTISLLLAALGKSIGNGNDETTGEKVFNNLLVNSDEKGDRHFKLILTQYDQETYKNIIKSIESLIRKPKDERDENYDSSDPDTASKKIKDNYNFFEKNIQSCGIKLNDIHDAIGKLMVVEIALDPKDDPQLIFECLNSTGLDLSQADLIRNYLLMGLDIDEQNRIYSDYWLSMERKFQSDLGVKKFDRFIRDYLTLKNHGEIPKIGEVYEDFKDYVQDGRINKELLIIDLKKYSKYFSKLALLDQEDNPDIGEILSDISKLKIDVAYPFLMEVYNDLCSEKDLLTEHDFEEILKLVESYIFRRSICGIPSHALNKIFATMSKDLDKDRYLESFKAALILKESQRRFPDDNEFEREFLVKDVYNYNNCRYCLEKLEDIKLHNEPIKEHIITIEHIMPQKLSIKWKDELGKDWEEVYKYLHTIGNLTLTGYNERYSNLPFLKKRDLICKKNSVERKCGFKYSPLYLNNIPGNSECWTIKEIQDRAKVLSERSKKLWPCPKLSPEILAKYVTKKSMATKFECNLQDLSEDENDE